MTPILSGIRTAESVCIGHPDKLCDRISDAILDEAIRADKHSRTALETLATKGRIIVAGEISCPEKIKIADIVRNTLIEAGYDPEAYKISNFVHRQSEDISSGVLNALETRQTGEKREQGEPREQCGVRRELGAGDQGTVYGYATAESAERLPLPLVYAHRICKALDRARTIGLIQGIHSDGKAQVSMQDGVIRTIVISIQHDEDKENLEEEIREIILPGVFDDTTATTTAYEEGESDDTTTASDDTPHTTHTSSDTIDWRNAEILINPSGRFVLGGPEADTGLTGRKLMVDTYGGLAPHGGGAFSGKDATKVDRSAAYAARYAAKVVIESGLAKECTVAISYAIGKADPVAVDVVTAGLREDLTNADISLALRTTFSFKPRDIIRRFKLKRPIYKELSCYGHFSNSESPWERVTDDDVKTFYLALEEAKDTRQGAEEALEAGGDTRQIAQIAEGETA